MPWRRKCWKIQKSILHHCAGDRVSMMLCFIKITMPTFWFYYKKNDISWIVNHPPMIHQASIYATLYATEGHLRNTPHIKILSCLIKKLRNWIATPVVNVVNQRKILANYKYMHYRTLYNETIIGTDPSSLVSKLVAGHLSLSRESTFFAQRLKGLSSLC